jgi:hypothetical protein
MLPDASRTRRSGFVEPPGPSPQWDRRSGELPIRNDFLFRSSSRVVRRQMIEDAYRRHETDLRRWEMQKEQWKQAKDAAAAAPPPGPVDYKCPSVSLVRARKSVQGDGGPLRKAVE